MKMYILPNVCIFMFEAVYLMYDVIWLYVYFIQYPEEWNMFLIFVPSFYMRSTLGANGISI